jgi:hypothetical protein
MDPLVVVIAVVVSASIFAIIWGAFGTRGSEESQGGLASRLDVYRPDYSQAGYV